MRGSNVRRVIRRCCASRRGTSTLGRGPDGTRGRRRQRALEATDAAHLEALGITRRIDKRDDIWEVKAGSHRVAYAVVDNVWVMLHAWRKKGQQLDPRALNAARKNLRRYLAD